MEQLLNQFIGGQWRPGRGVNVREDRNPFSGDSLGSFTVGSVEDVDDAYLAAQQAQHQWARIAPQVKRKVFDDAVRVVGERQRELTTLLVRETGSTVGKATYEIGLTIDSMREAATLPLRVAGEILPATIDDTENMVYRKPLGVVAVISPSNLPLFLSAKAVGAALALGNGVVLKPHEETPLTGGTVLAAIFAEAGLPAGLLNVVLTDIETIGDRLLESPVPRAVLFTGSSVVGRRVAEVSAKNLKPAVLELGGNNAFVVRNDADLNYAVDSAVFSAFTHQGQACLSATRILVHRDIADEFKRRLVDRVSALPIGDPADSGTVIGPLLTKRLGEALEAEVDVAIAAGATTLLRGERRGNLLPPIILSGVDPTSDLMDKELFGPVVLLFEFADDEQAVELANCSAFGLGGAVHTGDIDKGLALARRMDTGMVHVNDTSISDEAHVPFGGVKQSGSGRLGGKLGIDALTTTQWVSVNRGRRQYPY